MSDESKKPQILQPEIFIEGEGSSRREFLGTLGKAALTVSVWPHVAEAAGMYNIGTFWKAPASTANPTLWGWGGNGNGQLGLNNGTNYSSPVQVGTKSWSQISGAYIDVAAIRSDATLWMCGNGTNGVLGQGNTTSYSSPVQVGGSWAQVSTSASQHTLALRTDATLWAWGYGAQGQLGQGIAGNYSSPVQITGSWVQISAGGNRYSGSGNGFSAGIKTDGSLWAWGANTVGELATGDQVNRSSPVQIGGPWAQVLAGQETMFGIRTDGTLWSWGGNISGELGLGFANGLPTQIAGTWTKSVTGPQFSAAIRSDGTLWAWGVNSTGQLGQGNVTSYSSPVQITGSWIQLSVGGNAVGTLSGFSMGIRSDNTLWGWGNNASGQLGQGNATNRSSPVQIGGSWAQVCSGSDANVTNAGHTLAIRTDGTLWGWGLNTTGQLGIGTTTSVSSPVQVSGGGSWIQITAAGKFSLGIQTDNTLWTWGDNASWELGIGGRWMAPSQLAGSWIQAASGGQSNYGIRSDSTLWAWGLNTTGQLGVGNSTNYSSPVQIGGSWSQIAGGSTSTLGIRTDGTLWGWGSGSYGVLGVGNVTNYSSPVQVGGSWSQVVVANGAAGTTFAFGIRTDGTLWGWGYGGASGQLGQGNTSNYSSPVQIGGSWSQIAASTNSGASRSVGIRMDGTLWAWGDNTNGVLGTGNTTAYSSPVQVGGSWSQVTLGADHCMGVRSDGTAWVWGGGSAGVLGLGSSTNYSSPVQLGAATWSRLAGGAPSGVFFAASAGIRSNGTLWSWGSNNYGQLGIGTPLNYSSPVQVSGSWTQITHGGYSVLGIQTDGSLWSWGDNAYGELGLGTTPYAPNQLAGSWTQVAVGGVHGLAIKTDGTLWAWGSGSVGELGQGSTTSYSSPVQVPGSWTQVAAGGQTSSNGWSLAIRTDGTLWAFGYNYSGQLGQGTRTSYSSPVQISGSWAQISACVGDGCIGVKTDGTLWAWGDNFSGQLAQGIIPLSPNQVSGSWTQLGAGDGCAYGIKTDGTLWAWGRNDTGQLGQGNTTQSASPVQIAGNWTKIAAGNSSTTGAGTAAAIRSDNTLWAWGYNSSGQLGQGNTTNRSSPVQIGGSWSSVAVGQDFIIAIRK